MNEDEDQEGWILGTANGDIIQLTKIPSFVYKILTILEAIIENKVQTIGDFKHEEFVYLHGKDDLGTKLLV